MPCFLSLNLCVRLAELCGKSPEKQTPVPEREVKTLKSLSDRQSLACGRKSAQAERPVAETLPTLCAQLPPISPLTAVIHTMCITLHFCAIVRKRQQTGRLERYWFES